MSRCTHRAASDTRRLLAGLLRRPQAHPARRTSTGTPAAAGSEGTWGQRYVRGVQAEATVRAGACGRGVRRWWRGVAPLVLAGVVFAAGSSSAARAGELGAVPQLPGQAQSVISSPVAAGDAFGGPTDNAQAGAASGFSAGSGYLYWDNPQVGAIGRGTIDGDPANVNQSFVTGMLPSLDAHPVAVDRQHLYWGVSNWIGRANLDGSGINQKFISLGEYSAATQLALDDQHIYFIRGDISIGRANLDGSGVEEPFITVQGAAFMGLAVDSDHIYWTDQAHSSIGRANLDGSEVNQSFITGTGMGRGVAVDGRHIYWAQLIPNNPPWARPIFGTIGRANLDGTGMIWNFITGATEPTAVAVDFGHVYWANYYDCNYETDPPSSCAGGTIGRANLDGSEVNQSFITAYTGTSSGCSTGENDRCGPSSVAVSAPTQPVCLRTSPPPAPPIGGAVFAKALDQGGSDANVVVIPAGVS